jgi:hypothetical protein
MTFTIMAINDELLKLDQEIRSKNVWKPTITNMAMA